MPAYARKRKAYRAKRPVKRVPRKRSGGRKAITQIVKSVLSSQAENKIWFDFGANQPIISNTAGNPTFKNLVPTLANGTGHSSRIGNQVRVKSGYIRGHVNILPYNVTTNYSPPPCYVKMWICRYKMANTTVISATNISINFLDVTNAAVGLQGNMLDVSLPNNKEAWDIYATKVIRIGAGYTTSTAPVSTTAYFDNSPMSVPFSFNFGKHLKTLKYDDTTSTTTNKNLFIIFQVVPADGSAGNGQTMAEFHYSTKVEYEDL